MTRCIGPSDPDHQSLFRFGSLCNMDDDDYDDDDDDDNDDDDNDNDNDNNNQPYLVRVTLNSKADRPVALISGSN